MSERYPFFPGGAPVWRFHVPAQPKRPQRGASPQLLMPKRGAADERKQLMALARLLESSAPADHVQQRLQQVRARLLELDAPADGAKLMAIAPRHHGGAYTRAGS